MVLHSTMLGGFIGGLGLGRASAIHRRFVCPQPLAGSRPARSTGRSLVISAGLLDFFKKTDSSHANINKNTDYVVVGAGNAAGYVAKALKEKGLAKDRLCLVGDEVVAPYERPALTKAYLFPESPARLPGFHTSVGGGGERQTDEWYSDNGIELLKGQRVTGVSFENKLLTTSDGSLIKYRKLFIATGASPLQLSSEGSDLNGIMYVRNVADADKLVAKMKTAKKLVIVGGGYIGMECAAAGVINGLDTTMIFPDSHLMERLFTPEIAGHYEDLYSKQGVRLEKGELVDSFMGDADGNVTHVKMASGKVVEGDLVVVGIGASPVIGSFTGGSGLAVAEKPVNGILVDGNLKASKPDVWAVGDVAAFPLVRAGGALRRYEHVDNARKMAAHAVSSMLDPAGTPGFDYLPYFYSRVFEQPGSSRKVFWQFFGENHGDVTVLGDFKPELAAFWVDKGDGRLNGAFVESSPADVISVIRTAVETRAVVNLRGTKSLEAAVSVLTAATAT